MDTEFKLPLTITYIFNYLYLSFLMLLQRRSQLHITIKHYYILLRFECSRSHTNDTRQIIGNIFTIIYIFV